MTRVRNFVVPALTVAMGWIAVSLAACGSNPYLVNWIPFTDTVALYSTADTTPNLYDGFDFVNSSRAIIEGSGALGTWDLAVGTDSTGLVWMPPGAFGISSAAGVALLKDMTYDQAKTAPRDSSKYIHTAVPIILGVTYVVRTRKVASAYGGSCSHYGKLEPVDVDVATGRVRFIFDANPNCGDLRLKP